MKITKLDPYSVQDLKPKHRASSSSQEKHLSSVVKKKMPVNIVSIEPQFVSKPVGFYQQQRDGQYGQNEDVTNGSSQPLTHSKKAITGELLYKESKETFMDFLQTQMKNEQIQNGKNKIKLPLISSSKQPTNLNNVTDDDFPTSQTPDMQKLSSTKNTVQTG